MPYAATMRSSGSGAPTLGSKTLAVEVFEMAIEAACPAGDVETAPASQPASVNARHRLATKSVARCDWRAARLPVAPMVRVLSLVLLIRRHPSPSVAIGRHGASFGGRRCPGAPSNRLYASLQRRVKSAMPPRG